MTKGTVALRMYKERWFVGWKDKKGTTKWSLKEKPALFFWERMRESRGNWLKRAVEGLLNSFG
jgi:hypothetical protein